MGGLKGERVLGGSGLCYCYKWHHDGSGPPTWSRPFLFHHGTEEKGFLLRLRALFASPSSGLQTPPDPGPHAGGSEVATIDIPRQRS